MSANDALRLMHEVIDALNSGDRECFKAAGTTRTIHKDLAMNQVFLGHEEITKWAWSCRSCFPDLRAEITNEFAGGEQGVVEMVWTGTHRGPLPTPVGVIRATGKSVNVPGFFLFTVEEGKVAKITHYFDLGRLLMQLGHVRLPVLAPSLFSA